MRARVVEAIFTPIFTIAAAIASPVAVAPSFAIRFALIVSRRAIVVSHHEMTFDVISGVIGALGGVAPDASAPTAMVGRVAEEATHGASMVGDGKM